MLDQSSHSRVGEQIRETRKEFVTHLSGVSGLALGLIGALFALVGLSTGILKIAGLLSCVAAAIVIWRVSFDYERQRFTRKTLWALAACGVAVTFLIVALSVRVPGPGQAPSADAGQQNTTRASPTEPSSARNTLSPEQSSSATSASAGTGESRGDRADLGELPVVGRSDYSFGWKALTVDGTDHPKVFTAAQNEYLCQDGYIEYQLSKKYEGFHSMIGISDLAATGATATFEISVDGKVKAAKTISLFKVEPIDVSLVGAQRMKIEYSTTGCLDAGLIDPYLTAA